MTYRTLSLTLLTAAFASAAHAGEANPTHVVELFTSQGCSSCPPANRFVGKVAADNPNALVLSYGVTYWDFLGWKDTFGNPEFTERQRDYRDAFGASNIYTPQIILGGSAHSPRYSKKDVSSMPLPSQGRSLAAIRDGQSLRISAGDAPQGATLDLVSFIPGEQIVDVERGENGGRSLKLTNVVTDVERLNWTGETLTVSRPKQNGTSYALLLQDGETARILDAAIVN